MKKLLLSLVLASLLGGGGYFAWSALLADAGSGGAKGGAHAAPVYVELEPFTAPFIRDGKFAQYVVLVVNLEVQGEAEAEAVRKWRPKLRDAFVSELHALAALRPPEQRMIDLARIKARLRAGAKAVLGADVVRDVLVQLAH